MNDDTSVSVHRGSSVSRITHELLTGSRFAMVGIVATLVHMVVVWTLVRNYDLPVFRGNFIAYVCAFGFSFAGHHFWTFKSAGQMRTRLLRFFMISLVAFLCNSTVLAEILRTGFFSPAFSALIAVTTIPLLTFVASRLWGFRAVQS